MTAKASSVRKPIEGYIEDEVLYDMLGTLAGDRPDKVEIVLVEVITLLRKKAYDRSFRPGHNKTYGA